MISPISWSRAIVCAAGQDLCRQGVTDRPLNSDPWLAGRTPQAGFSLVEILLVIGILGVVLGAAVLLFTTAHASFWSADANIQIQQEARRALETMDTELRQANHIDTELTSPDADTPAGGATRLNFQISRGYNVAGCTPNAVCWGNDTTNGSWVHYLRNGTQLVRCQSSTSDTVLTDFSTCRVLANEAQTFFVDYAGSTRTVTLRLQIERISNALPGGNRDTGILRNHIRLRNP